MTKSKILSVVSYITWIGLIIAFILRDKGDSLVRRHINQALMLNIVCTVGSIISRFGLIGALVGWVINIAAIVLMILGIYRAVKGSEEPLPFIGGITLL